MALRAGYYGVKRFLRDKLETIAGTYDETIKSLFPRSEQAVLGAINLLKNTHGTDTIRGVTFTMQTNESIDINGTQDNTGDGSEYVVNGQNSSGKRLKLSDYPNNLAYDIGVAYDNTNVLAGIWYYDNNETYLGPQTALAGQTGFVLSPPTGAVYFLPFFRVLKDKTVNHVMVYPMLYLSSISKPPFAPYAMTNKELTDSEADQKTAINAIITAATGAADFAAFKTAIGAITPVTRSLTLTKEDITEEVKEDVEPEKTVTKKRTTKKTEEV